jgi:hypothetical protein
MAWNDLATEKQLYLIMKLQKELGRTPKTFGGITKRQANTLITDLQDELTATNAYEAANGI